MKSFNQLKKNLRFLHEGQKTIRLAVLADNASQLTVQAIKGYGIESGICFEIYEADYDQVGQEIFNTQSGLYRFQPEFIFINFSTEHLLKKFYSTPYSAREAFAVSELSNIRSLLTVAFNQVNVKIILNNFIEINDAVFGHFATKERKSFLFQLRKLNLSLMELAQELNNLYICDFQALQSSFGRSFVFDTKMYVSADMVYSIEFLPHLAKSLTDIILSITGIFKKCVILDLDNTLWGGIIGDDGIEGIQVGNLGIGKAFSELQLWLKELKNRGIILAVCSKNSEIIAKEPFDEHPDMVLRMQDIAIFVANWENKVDNIKYIQSVLNIGFDSMVFLDDNKFEREMVKSEIADLTVPEMPEDPAEYLNFLRSLNLFETASFTEEDELRTSLYQEEAKRTQVQKSFASEDEFLQSLDMISVVKQVDKFSAPRVAQLTQRSNQFNLRTIRYTESEILEMIKAAEYYLLSLTLEDKFGNHGLVSSIILKGLDAETLFIDTWLMSCRVLKRGMEYFTLNCIVEYAKNNKFKTLIGEYLPTRKNGLVKEHYSNLGFKQFSDSRWELQIDNYEIKKIFITLSNNNE